MFFNVFLFSLKGNSETLNKHLKLMNLDMWGNPTLLHWAKSFEKKSFYINDKFRKVF